MAMGRQRDRQGEMLLSWDELPKSPGHVFYDRLQEVLLESRRSHQVSVAPRRRHGSRTEASTPPSFKTLGAHRPMTEGVHLLTQQRAERW
jgi:hypothetical protein